MLSSTWSSGVLLLDTVSASLGWGSGAVATLEGDPSPIPSTLEGPPARILSSSRAPTSLEAPSETVDRWLPGRGSSLGLLLSISRSLHLVKTALDASHRIWGWTHPLSPQPIFASVQQIRQQA